MAQLGDRPAVRIIRMRKVPFIDSTGILKFIQPVQNVSKGKDNNRTFGSQ